MKRILIVEDDVLLAEQLSGFLSSCDYVCKIVSMGEHAKKVLRTQKIDLCLLDVGLPDYSGFELCAEIRTFYDGTIIMLTAYDLEDDIVLGLQSGADDYITKPCSLKILKSRVQSQFRRMQRSNQPFPSRLKSGELIVDLQHRMVTKGESILQLGETEMDLCAMLIQSEGRIMPRELLLDRIWDNREKFIEDNTLTVHVSRLRKKLGLYNGEHYIETIKGIGYRWNCKVMRD